MDNDSFNVGFIHSANFQGPAVWHTETRVLRTNQRRSFLIFLRFWYSGLRKPFEYQGEDAGPLRATSFGGLR